MLLFRGWRLRGRSLVIVDVGVSKVDRYLYQWVVPGEMELIEIGAAIVYFPGRRRSISAFHTP